MAIALSSGAHYTWKKSYQCSTELQVKLEKINNKYEHIFCVLLWGKLRRYFKWIVNDYTLIEKPLNNNLTISEFSESILWGGKRYAEWSLIPTPHYAEDGLDLMTHFQRIEWE